MNNADFADFHSFCFSFSLLHSIMNEDGDGIL